MRKLFTLLSVLPVASVAFGQVNITSADMPVPTAAYHLRNFTSSSAPNPVAGTSATWDYSTYAGTPDSAVYVTETDTFFTNAGVDVYRSSFKSLLPGLGYYVYGEFDFNGSNIKESAIDVLDQPYDISGTTGGSSDSLIIPAQRQLLTTAREIVHFPFTAGSAWNSNSTRTVTFYLSVAAASLSHAPIQHTYHVIRRDSITGWGKLKVYTSAGASMQYDVLMDKISEYAADSFYMGGSPAPATLLAAFGMYQGQKTDSNYRYNFYRKGSFIYLLSYYYGSDATYTNSVSKFMSSDNVTPAGVASMGNIAYSSILFPNPTNSSEINVMISGKNVSNGNYTITDMTGKTVQSGAIEMLQGTVHVALNTSLAAGNYVINIADREHHTVVTEQFTTTK